MKKKSLFKRISRLFLTFFAVLFMIGCKAKYPFDLSENAQIFIYDSDNLFGLKKIISDEGILIYQFENNKKDSLSGNILTTIKEKEYVMIPMCNEYQFSFDKISLFENKTGYYIMLEYSSSDNNSDLNVFGFELKTKEERYSVKGTDAPYLLYLNYEVDNGHVFDSLYQEYDYENKKWFKKGIGYSTSENDPVK